MRDKDVRTALRSSRHFLRLHKCLDTKVIDEVEILDGRVRADVMVVNGNLHGFEIKSETDSLDRLPQQIEAYSKVFEYASVVVATRHLEGAFELLPEWWGVFVAEVKNGQCVITENRKPRKNKFLYPDEIVKFLWRDEMVSYLSEISASDGMTSKPKRVLRQRLVETMSTPRLCSLVRTQLKKRESWRSVRGQMSSAD